jgi:hypothetical protein
VEDPNNMGIPKWLGIRPCFQQGHHDIWVSPCINRVPIISNIIGRIIDLHHLATVYSFASYVDCIPLFICELAVHITFVVSLKEAPKNMVFQFRYECLECQITLVFADEGIYIDGVIS